MEVEIGQTTTTQMDTEQTMSCVQTRSKSMQATQTNVVFETEPDIVMDTQVNRLQKVQPTSSDITLPETNKKTTFEWVKTESAALFPLFPSANYEDCRDLLPHQQFEKFFDESLLKHICDQSELYAVGLNKPNPNITVDELRTFIGILIISGYNYHTSYKAMWSHDEDIRNELVINSMRKNRFEDIYRFLHFEDNSKGSTRNGPNPDKMWKLRPITDHIKAKMIENFHLEQNLSYDESMIAYFGKHGCKQFIKGKPLRFGFKVWSLCTPSGYMVNFEIYQGNNPRANPVYEEKFGKCAAPLIQMIEDLPQDMQALPFAFYFDNLFTSFPLLAYLKSSGYEGTGTIRENRIPSNCPLPHKHFIKSKERGYSDSITMKSTGIRLTKWKDNNVVCMLSTSLGENPKSIAVRYSKVNSGKINIPRPCAITEYNKYMCGVDRFDQNVAHYRIAYRGKKWWSCIFTWLIDACDQNAWQLHLHVHSKMSQLQFRRELAVYLCKHYGTKSKSAGRPSNLLTKEGKNVLRFDGKDHFVVPSNRRYCAGERCKTNGRTACAKCNVGLCVKCFADYHTE